MSNSQVRSEIEVESVDVMEKKVTLTYSCNANDDAGERLDTGPCDWWMEDDEAVMSLPS